MTRRGRRARNARDGTMEKARGANDPRSKSCQAESGLSSKPNDRAAQSKPGPGLYLVATPIGNAADMSLRAIAVLRAVDVVACEDTRTTGKLLAMHDIQARLTPYHEHNAARARPKLLRRLAEGEAVALVADAGTPLISDPGYKLVRAAVAAGVRVYPVPGASAPIAALIVSGLPTDRFYFAGFLPSRAAARRRALEPLVGLEATLVILESPRRLAQSLTDIALVLGNREAAVTRELTKIFEEVRRGRLDDLAAHYAAAAPPKGEVVLVVGPPEDKGQASAEDWAMIDAKLTAALGKLSLRDAVTRVAAETGQPRRAAYSRAVALKERN